MSRDKKFKTPEQLQYLKPRYIYHTTEYGGFLPDAVEAHACWHYVRLATLHLVKVDEGAWYEGESDTLLGLDKLMYSTQLIYELEDSDKPKIYACLPLCKAEAERCGLPWDSRIEDPVGGKNTTSKLILPRRLQ